MSVWKTKIEQFINNLNQCFTKGRFILNYIEDYKKKLRLS